MFLSLFRSHAEIPSSDPARPPRPAVPAAPPPPIIPPLPTGGADLKDAAPSRLKPDACPWQAIPPAPEAPSSPFQGPASGPDPADDPPSQSAPSPHLPEPSLADAMRLCDGLWQRALQFVACYFDQHQEPLDALPPHGAPPWRVRRLPDWKEFSLIITILKRIQDGRRQALMLAAQSQGSAPAGDSSDTERTARLAASLREAAERLRRMDLDDDEPDDL